MGSHHFGSVGIHTGAGTGVGRQVVDVVVVLGSFLPLPLSLFLWVGAGGAWAPSQLGGSGWVLCSQEELLLYLGDSGIQCGNLLG